MNRSQEQWSSCSELNGKKTVKNLGKSECKIRLDQKLGFDFCVVAWRGARWRCRRVGSIRVFGRGGSYVNDFDLPSHQSIKNLHAEQLAHNTLPRKILLCPINWGAYLGLNGDKLNCNYNRRPWQLKKIKILGAVLELPAKQHCQFVRFTKKSGKMG